ncbi:MAG: hypothetical protein IIX96_03445 [Clostridia bacterium]|nr:hypothetical protein [Clostridia bacterium]
MTNDEAKTALFKRTPVVCNGIEYLCITGITYRVNSNNELIISAELLDKNKRSVTNAQLKDVISL